MCQDNDQSQRFRDNIEDYNCTIEFKINNQTNNKTKASSDNQISSSNNNSRGENQGEKQLYTKGGD